MDRGCEETFFQGSIQMSNRHEKILKINKHDSVEGLGPETVIHWLNNHKPLWISSGIDMSPSLNGESKNLQPSLPSMVLTVEVYGNVHKKFIYKNVHKSLYTINFSIHCHFPPLKEWIYLLRLSPCLLLRLLLFSPILRAVFSPSSSSTPEK